MPFYHQSWFWVGVFTSTASIGGVLIREWISKRAQTELERLRLYESDLFKAHNELYHFVSHAYNWLWPPNEPEREFYDLMRHSYFKDVKANMLYFDSKIRTVLAKLEAQYECMNEPDLSPEKPFEKFFDEDLYDLFKQLEKAVKGRADDILHKGRRYLDGDC